MLRLDAAIPAYDKSDWQSENSSIEFADLRVAHHYWIVHLETLAISKPRSRYLLCNSTRCGISSRHGSHQVAQKSRRTIFPRYAESWNCPPVSSGSEKSGATILTVRFACWSPDREGCPRRKITNAIATATMAIRKFCFTEGTIPLIALLYGIALVDPIRAEIIGHVQNLHLAKAQGMQCIISRLD